MKKILFLLSIVCLLLTLLPSFMVYAGLISLQLNKTLMLVGTMGWFLLAALKMNAAQHQPS
ncbi:hypothetical protein [Cesiribacter sp. SM1]|uniref:hypothetical protein n=1 Tax=Cesiribacter sp. SM1 TaxID=2861196 RepID=UPI001CD230C4|nr:hypothetical protein [Cesiribacter sp. SM1]